MEQSWGTVDVVTAINNGYIPWSIVTGICVAWLLTLRHTQRIITQHQGMIHKKGDGRMHFSEVLMHYDIAHNGKYHVD